MLKSIHQTNNNSVEIYFLAAHNLSFATFRKKGQRLCDPTHKKGCFMSSASLIHGFALSVSFLKPDSIDGTYTKGCSSEAPNQQLYTTHSSSQVKDFCRNQDLFSPALSYSHAACHFKNGSLWFYEWHLPGVFMMEGESISFPLMDTFQK